MLKFNSVKAALVTAVLTAPIAAFATGDDYTSMSGAVDWGSAKTAILAIAVLSIGVTALLAGVGKVRRAAK